jgi:DhnA family fructose-bisphosphate aldolase class Ia
MDRILPGNKGLWVPIDHGVSDWPVDGLADTESLIERLTTAGGADAIVAHRGPLASFGDTPPANWKGGWVLHISASTRHGGESTGYKVLAGEPSNVVLSAIDRGAVAVSVQVNVGDENESEMLESLSRVADECQLMGVPLLGMMYPRGPNLSPLPDDQTNGVAHAARIGWELGCDIVKVPWTGSPESFAEVIRSVPIPVLVSGGPKSDDFREVLRTVRAAMAVGASGVCMGRQIFGDADPAARLGEVREIIHGIPWDADGRFRFDVEEADGLDDLYDSFRRSLDRYEVE